jgi:hypothetical protein
VLRVASLVPLGIGIPSAPCVVDGSATICSEAGMAVVLMSFAVLEGGVFEDPVAR